MGCFSEEQLQTMSETEAWKHIYAADVSKQNLSRPQPAEVCFTGFTDDAKIFLMEKATQAGFIVRNSVTSKLTILVAGANAGPGKLAKATRQSCTITDAEGFLAYIVTTGRNPGNIAG